MHTRQKLLLLKTLQGINQRKYKFRKRTKMLLLIHHEFILKNLVYCMLGERALVRNFWMTNYHQHWFETIWRLRRHQFVSKFFKCEFRVTPDTFEFILQLMNRSMSRDNTIFRDAIGIEKRVGI